MPKASVERNWEIRNLRRIQFTMQEEQLYTECRQDERTSVYQSYCVFSLLFRKKNLNNARYSMYGNLLPVFNTEGSPLDLRRNKTTNSSTSIDPFSAATKTLYYASVNSICAKPPPPPPPPSGYRRAFAPLFSPGGGGGHLHILGCPGAGHLATPGRTLNF